MNISHSKKIGIGCLGMLFWALITLPVQAGDARFSEDTVSLGSTEDADLFFPQSITTNAEDFRHLAFLIKKGNSFHVVADGVVGKPCQGIAKGTPIFNISGSRFAYIESKDDQARVISNEKAQPWFDDVDGLRFSPDGKRLIYRAKNRGKQMLVEDGDVVKRFDGIKDKPVFSPDSRHLAFIGVNGKKKVSVVLDGDIILKGYQNAREPIFSPDSKHFAIAVKDKNSWKIAKDGKVLDKGYKFILSLKFSPNSKRFVHAAQTGQELFLVLDGSETRHFKTVSQPVFSPDSSRFAYAGYTDEKWQVMLEGKASPRFKKVAALKFSPDSNRFAFAGMAGADEGAVVVDNHNVNHHDSVGQPVFSPNSEHLAYRMREENNWHMVKDGEKDKAYDAMRRPFFSPDSKTLAYPAVRGEKMCMVVNQKPGKTYEKVGLPFFSPDSEHLVYKAKKEGQWLLVVNSKECEKRFDGFIKDYPVMFSKNGCHALAVNKKLTSSDIFQKEKGKKKRVFYFYRYEVKF